LASKDTEVTFSAEKQFIHGDSFNRGFVQVPRMIVNCIGLSAEAKAVFNSLSAYVYEHGRSAFPSIHRIAINTNLTGKSVVKYLAELCDLGFVEKSQRGRGLTNIYKLIDAHEVYLLHVSEMLHKALDGAVSRKKTYTVEMVEEAKRAFEGAMTEQGLTYSDISHSDESREIIEEQFISIMEGGKPNLYKMPIQQKSVPKTLSTSVPTDKGKLGRLDRMDNTWGTDEFRQHFYDLYNKETGLSHDNVTLKHRGSITRILKQLDGDKFALRKAIEAFFSMGYDNKTLEWFSTSGRLAEIQTFIREGKKPFYLEPKKSNAAVQKAEQAKEAKQESQGLDKNELLRRLRGEK
jgi:predicted transcriptional regulator